MLRHVKAFQEKYLAGRSGYKLTCAKMGEITICSEEYVESESVVLVFCAPSMRNAHTHNLRKVKYCSMSDMVDYILTHSLYLRI